MPIRVPLSWLKEYVDITVKSEELAERLTLAGIEVEHIIRIGEEWENIYTGYVSQIGQHPNADRLNLVTVKYGEGRSITVVTGAPNIEQGDKVVIGLVGSRYLDQHVAPPRWSSLKPAKIRGIQTEGMVMSEAELGISEEHEGIIRLDPSTPIGLPAREVLGDTILQIDLTPNNGRLLSMVGLAREVAALFGGELRLPAGEWQEEGPNAEEMLAVEIEDPDLCARYTGAVIQGVRIGPSPGWMQRRLALAGMRPVNNIVDITNYVMLEMGQPLHAFDYHAVEGHRIVVRRARPGERITTLDHVERVLEPKMLAICDVNKPVALAGVMGGAESEIGVESRDVILESAHFQPATVRRTARLLKLPSEASHRFERWVDPNLTVPALKRAAEMMRQLAGGTIARGYVDEYPRPLRPKRIHFYTSEVERLLGIKVPPSQIAELLRRLGFGVELPHNADAVGQDTTMLVDVPSYRNDVTLPADLVEEVARMIGYDLIPETLIEGTLPKQEVNRSLEAEGRLRDIMVACGMDEIIDYPVMHSSTLERLAQIEREAEPAGGERQAYRLYDTARPLVTILNPLSVKQDVLRPSLIPNMLDTLRNNLRVMPETPVRIFELGKVFLTPNEEEVIEKRRSLELEREKYPRIQAWEPIAIEVRLPLEPRRLAGMMAGPRTPKSRFGADSEAPEAQLDFFDAKGVIEGMLRHLHIEGVEWLPADAPLFHPGRVALLRVEGVDLGVIGEIHPAVVEEWGIPAERLCAWDIDAEALIEAIPDSVIYNQVSQYVPVRQDMAFVVDEGVPAAQVAGAIERAGGNIVTEVSLFDIYRGNPIKEGRKSLAFALTLISADKPLGEAEITRLRRRIEGALGRELGAELRG